MTRERYIRNAEHHIIGKYSYNNEYDRIRQQFTGYSRKNIHIGGFQPFIAGTEFYFASYRIDGNEQDDYLEQDEKERMTQVDRIIQVGIE